MAMDTDIRLQNQVIYSIYVRSHTQEGTFRAVVPDLDRIRALGTDIVWLMPIHPIGEKGKKGSLGCPYANRDYRSVNPAYGTMEDFRALVDAIHERGMRCIIDVVYNHTSPDSVLWAEHPEYFYKKPDGRPGNRVGDWTDIIDLDYSNKGLWDYQIESLRYWAGFVDGFRCDVASLVPLDFWLKAREEVEKVRPGCIWLAESVHASFNALCRLNELYACCDRDLYEAFDIEYEYDIRESFDKFLRGEEPLSSWIDMLNFQEGAYPKNYNKLRFLENHDQPRIASFVNDEERLKVYTAMLYFMKGTTLIFGGQERGLAHLPALFDKDSIDWNGGFELSSLMKKLSEIKHGELSPGDLFFAFADDSAGAAVMIRKGAKGTLIGVFPLNAKPAEIRNEFCLGDGLYCDLLSGSDFEIRNNTLNSDGHALILRLK